ncbi:MAG: aminoglycoside adenylyltransferase domain-containing protein [Candidatus Promineifilaceae bacterium]
MTDQNDVDNMAGVEEIGRAFRDGLKGILGGKLVGAYIYGATVFPETRYTGDIDFHVILGGPLTDNEREQLNDLHESMAREFPPLGKEMDGYYILLEDAKKKSPPKSQMWKQATDNSWALHREHIRAGRCIVLEGLDPRQLYPATSWNELEEGLRGELEYVERHLVDYPAYCALNLCRLMYSFQTRDVVISKTAAGLWAEGTYPQWSELIQIAVKSYEGRATPADDQFMLNQIPGLYNFAIEQIEDS